MLPKFQAVLFALIVNLVVFFEGFDVKPLMSLIILLVLFQ